jgi:hypothetical protein
MTSKTVTIEQLTQDFGAPINVAPYGACLIIPGDKFDPDWEVLLGDQGYEVHNVKLEKQEVSLIKLKKTVPYGKTVYVPPKVEDPLVDDLPPAAAVAETKPEPEDLEDIEKEETTHASVEPVEPERKNYHEWTEQEEALLLKEHDRLVSEGKGFGSQTEVGRIVTIEGLSPATITSKLKKLISKRPKTAQNSGRIQSRKKRSEKIAETRSDIREIPKIKIASAPAELPAIDTKELWETVAKLQEVYDSLNRSYVELKSELEAQKKFSIEKICVQLNENTDDIKKLKYGLPKHKHAVSGEAMVPMEA